MALDRQPAGIVVLRICIGVFFIFEGLGKIRWFTDSSVLAGQFADVVAGGAGRIDQLSGICSGSRRRASPSSPGSCRSASWCPGWRWWPVSGRRSFAFVAFFMVLNFHIASGALFKYSFLTNGYGLPVLGSTLALALSGGGRRTKKLKPKSEKP